MNTVMPYLRLMRFDRPIGIFLTLWPSLWAVWLAGDLHPPIKIVIIFVLGAIVMRAAGCVINDIADRNFDPHVARTKTRPLARGDISLWQAIIVFIVLMLAALVLVLQLNRYCLWIALVAAVITIIYPFCKRYTYLPQLVLGIVFNIGVLMAFAALQNRLSLLSWILYIATIIWTMAYDTMYAMTDKDDDKRLGLKSTALLFSTKAPFIIACLQAVFLAGLLTCGLLINAKLSYWIALVLALGLSVYQQYLLKQEKPFQAFLNNNWLGLVVFLGIIIS